MKNIHCVAVSMLISSALANVNAEEFTSKHKNIMSFPDGMPSLAEEVVSYSAGKNVSAPYNNASNIIGLPDYMPGDQPEFVSLGDGGEIVIQLASPGLTASGTEDKDLWVFEIGSKIEPVDVHISMDATQWIHVGSTMGGIDGVDIDQYVGQGGVERNKKYRYEISGSI